MIAGRGVPVQDLARSFIQYSSHLLGKEYLPRLEETLEILPSEGIWWRPHAGGTSIANLLLHLEGNVRQWILCGLGGQQDERQRQKEFTVEEGETAELFPALAATVIEACGVIEAQSAEELARPVVIQGFETSKLKAVYHVLEHFAWHTGQVVWIAKMLAGKAHGLSFYDDEELNEAHDE